MTMQSCACIGSICKRGCGGAALSALLIVGGAGRSPLGPSPLRLAIYYGYPSLVNGARGALVHAVAVFSDYDVIVLGDGLEFGASQPGHGAGHEDHAFTERLIRALQLTPRHPDVYGYVDLGRTQQLRIGEIAERIDLWSRMGAGGVFLDEAGYDFGVTRERQNAAITAAHARGLRALLNAFRPNDLFSAARTPLNEAGGGNPTGLAPVISAEDAVLLESFAVRDGVPETVDGLIARTRAALDGRSRLGTRVFAVSTSGDRGYDATLAHYGWRAASEFGLDAYGWGMPAFSAITSELPSLPRPEAEGARPRAEHDGAPTFRDAHRRRTTTVETIVLDSTTRRGALEPR